MSRRKKNARVETAGDVQNAAANQANEVVAVVAAGEVAGEAAPAEGEQDNAGVVAVAVDDAGDGTGPAAESGPSSGGESEAETETALQREACDAVIEFNNGSKVAFVGDGEPIKGMETTNARVEQPLEQQTASQPDDLSAVELAPADALVVAADDVGESQDGAPEAATQSAASEADQPDGNTHGSDGEASEGKAPAGSESAFQCEACDKVAEAGDRVCPTEDGGCLCEACAPKWGELLERPAAFDMTPEEAKHEVTAHLAAGGSLDDPFVGDIALTQVDVGRLTPLPDGVMQVEGSPSVDRHFADAIAYVVHAARTKSDAINGMEIKADPNFVLIGVDAAAPGGDQSTADDETDAVHAYYQLATPIRAAEDAARAVMATVEAGLDTDTDLKLLPDDDLAKYVCGLKEAADFIRSGGVHADGKVFWNHLSLGGFHASGLNSWDDLPFALRVGWATFGAVLVTYDAFAAEDAAKGRQPEPAPLHRVPIEDTTLELVDGVLARFDDKR